MEVFVFNRRSFPEKIVNRISFLGGSRGAAITCKLLMGELFGSVLYRYYERPFLSELP